MVRACVVSLLLLATACPGPGTAVTSPGGGGPGSGSGPRGGGGSGTGHVDGGGGGAVAIDNSCPAPGCVYHGGIVGGVRYLETDQGYLPERALSMRTPPTFTLLARIATNVVPGL